jgi:hypothetical protein
LQHKEYGYIYFDQRTLYWQTWIFLTLDDVITCITW